jgi:hypothetical protein
LKSGSRQFADFIKFKPYELPFVLSTTILGLRHKKFRKKQRRIEGNLLLVEKRDKKEPYKHNIIWFFCINFFSA